MREIYKTYSQKGKKQVKITTISIALLVAATFILSAAAPVFAIQTHTTKLNEIETETENEIQTTTLAPRSKENTFMPADVKSSDMVPAPIGNDCYIMYMEHAISGGGAELFSIDTCDPGTIVDELGNSEAGNFMAAGTYGCDEVWYGVEYGSGLLWGIDIYTGEMWSIGGGGTGLNGLAYDPLTNRMFGVDGSDNIWQVDPDTGEQDMIGNLGYSGGLMIGMAYDADGQLYGWELVTDKLWKVDPDEPSAEEVGPLGIAINFAQDGDFHRESDQLYLTAYTTGGNLYKCDKETGTCELVGGLPNNWECTASVFENGCVPPEHDIRLVSIDAPVSGRAEPDMDMTITVKNTGNNTETFDAQMEIIKCESGPLIMEEYFDGGVLPDDWETDYWTIVNSGNAGGSPPEARCYRFDYTQTYDNYIMSGQTDCTGAEKVNLRFRWAGQYGTYAQYASVYVKFRRNSTSPWKDVTPWDNPVGEDQDGELYEIGCYGFGEPIGEEFQIMWNYIGYYYYFEYLYLDDVSLELCGGCAEYAELVEDITLAKEEETQIQFPKWTPSEWRNESSENTWEDYPVHGFIILDGDENPRNDQKWNLMNLWYPWLYDIEVMSIDSPHEEGRGLPGQTFPVQATMQNVGQYEMCCIPMDISIGNPYIIDTVFSEFDWPGSGTYYPGQYSGWTDEHKTISYYYGWQRYYNSYAGGDPYEAYIPYYYCRQDYVFYSMAIDTSAYQSLRLRFLTYINHYSGQGLYSLEAGYSTDGETWYAAWHEEPSSTGGYEVDVPIAGGSETTYIGFWCKGNPFYFNYWYLDNVELVAVGFTEEFSDFACQGPDIDPGEEVTFTFADWTPARLLDPAEETGSEDYIVECMITAEGDVNPGNDIKTEELTLDFWHDVGIDEITSPTGGNPERDRLDELLYDNGEPDGVNGYFFGYYAGTESWLIDDFTITQKTDITGIKFRFVWGPGYASNMEKVNVIIVEDTDDCDPDTGPYYAQIETEDFEEYPDGQTWFTRPGVVCEAQFDGITVQPGKYFIGVMPDGIIDTYAYWLTTPLKNCVHFWYSTYFGYAKWTPGSQLGYNTDLSWAIYGGGGAPKVKAWIQPGTEDIDAVVKNYGTFMKEDLTCYAEIYDYFDDPENGTQVYTDEISNIDLTTPLGGERNLQFADFTFADEGRYGLFLSMPATPDDEEKNNDMKWGVAVDDTNPDCDYPPILDPADPTGEEDWYVDDVTVTLNASDPRSNDVSSGVKEIRYTINSGTEEVISGSTGTFVLTEDGDDILVEYWAIDWVGNVEPTKNSFTIDIDQTVPDIALKYEVLGWVPLEGWEFQFTATATDAMSGMDRVEFYFNNELQETVSGSGPEYVFTVYYIPLPGTAVFRSTAIDIAGLSHYDEIINPVTSSHPQSHPQSQQSQEVPRGQPLPR